MKFFGITSGALIIIFTLFLAWCHFGENPSRYFSDYNELLSSGYFQKGWIPELLPKSSYDIHETHNIDTNKITVKFKFRPDDIESIEDACERINSDHEQERKYHCSNNGHPVDVALTREGKGVIRSKRQ